MANYPFTTNLTTSSCRRSMTSLTASSFTPPATTNFKLKRSYPCHHSISRPQPSNTIRVRVRDTRWLKPTSDASKDPSTTTPSAWTPKRPWRLVTAIKRGTLTNLIRTSLDNATSSLHPTPNSPTLNSPTPHCPSPPLTSPKTGRATY